MGLLSLLFTDPRLFILLAGVLLYSVIAHEVSHGWAAYLFGDDTARRYGRLTFNPASHLDPVGTLMLFLVGFGWARPVPVDYYNLKHSRAALICVSLAGCAANILIAILALFLLHIGGIGSHPVLSVMLPEVVRVNIILGAFNLIPIPPLDGSKILMGFLPLRAQEVLSGLEPYGFFLLAALLFTGLLDPLIVFMQNIIIAMIAALFGFLK
ncbi:MAG: site-2 protease family protein [Candidatus Omnitrophica bacterium]|nr:site-2 protease family protein [Candidatus Omnitrophota bacterium]